MKKLLFLLLMTLAVTYTAKAGTYYSRVNVSVESGEGKVYASTDASVDEALIKDSSFTTAVESVKSSSASVKYADKTYYLFAKPERGYAFISWNDGKTANPYQVSVRATSENESSPTEVSYTAIFEPSFVTIASNNTSLGSVSIDKPINKPGDVVTLTAKLVQPIGNNEFGTASHPSRSISFDGWFDEDGNLLSKELTYKHNVTDKIEVIEGRFSREYTITADAEGNIAGYYRMQTYMTNPGTNYYLTMLGTTKISTSGNERYLTGAVGFGPEIPVWGSYPNSSYAQSEAVYANPANVFYVTGTATNDFHSTASRTVIAKDLRAFAQGTSVNELVSGTPAFELKAAITPGYYLISYSIGTVQKHYFEALWVTTDKPTDANFKNNGDFDVQPVDLNHIDTNYFGAMPSEDMAFEGGYWTSMYTSFPYECYEQDGVEPYIVVNAMDKDNCQYALIKRVNGGIVPAETPVLLKCKNLTPKENRLLPLLPSDSRIAAAQKEVTDNLLSGSFSLWTARTFPSGAKYHTPSGRPEYDAESMHVFSVSADGNVGFYKLADKEDGSAQLLAPNKVYLDKSKLPAEMQAAPSLRVAVDNGMSGIFSVDESYDAPLEYYTIEGVKVANPEHGHLYIVRKGTKARKVIY